MSRPRVFVPQPIPQRALADLREIADVEMFPFLERRPTTNEMLTSVRDADYLFALGENPITREVIQEAKRLKLIAAMEIFPTQIDFQAATEKGIPVSGLPHGDEITETTAEYTMALLLSVAWGIPRADRFLREKRWVQYQSVALPARRVRGKTLGILGFGKIGRGLARRAKAFGMDVLYYDIVPYEQRNGPEHGARATNLDELLARSDFVAVCVLLTKDTEALISESFLASMKPGAILINTSRGRVVDEVALADALIDGKLSAIGLDVYRQEIPDPEPGPSDERLFQIDNAVLTPHIGTSAMETREWMARHVVTCIADHLDGSRPSPILNPEVYGEPPLATNRIG